MTLDDLLYFPYTIDQGQLRRHLNAAAATCKGKVLAPDPSASTPTWVHCLETPNPQSERTPRITLEWSPNHGSTLTLDNGRGTNVGFHEPPMLDGSNTPNDQTAGLQARAILSRYKDLLFRHCEASRKNNIEEEYGQPLRIIRQNARILVAADPVGSTMAHWNMSIHCPSIYRTSQFSWPVAVLEETKVPRPRHLYPTANTISRLRPMAPPIHIITTIDTDDRYTYSLLPFSLTVSSEGSHGHVIDQFKLIRFFEPNGEGAFFQSEVPAE